jgi:Flp pilus assembly protein TadD
MKTDGCREMNVSRARLLNLALVVFLTASGQALPAQGATVPGSTAQGSTLQGSSTQAPSPAAPAMAPASTQVQLSPEDLGNLQLARRQYQGAIQTFMEIPNKSALVWNKIGIAYQQLFMTDDAQKSYEKALKLAPKNSDILNNLGSVYYSRKEFSIAEHYYRKALKYEPNSALIYKNLGTDLMAADKFKKGWTCYQTAMEMDPEIFERANLLRIGEPTPTQQRGAMNYYLAMSYVKVGKLDLAVDYLRRAIDEGFTDRKKVLMDKEFASLRGSSAFDRLISEQQVQ